MEPPLARVSVPPELVDPPIVSPLPLLRREFDPVTSTELLVPLPPMVVVQATETVPPLEMTRLLFDELTPWPSTRFPPFVKLEPGPVTSTELLDELDP